MTLGSLFILLRAMFCISANLTVNESIVGKKYPYLQTRDRQFWNFFDRGMLANCLQFWLVGNPMPDWALIYQRECQVRVHARCLEGFWGLVPHMACLKPSVLPDMQAPVPQRSPWENLTLLLARVMSACTSSFTFL